MIVVRTEEEILADNLNGALPEGEGEFESVFVAESIDESITAVYKAVNGKGYVFVVGEVFVGTDAEGNVVTDTDDAVKTAVSSSATAIINSEIKELDISGYEMPKQIEKAYKTASGNYVFDLKASAAAFLPFFQASKRRCASASSKAPFLTPPWRCFIKSTPSLERIVRTVSVG